MRDANVLSCISCLLLQFYSQLADSDAREAVDESVELVLGVFADIQARLMFPPDAAATVVQSVKTQRHLRCYPWHSSSIVLADISGVAHA
jgi:hypothetical protein